jgi:predicted nucleic acid-binding protein
VKTTADTSVLVASFASWHEHHAAAVTAVEGIDLVIAHCLLETYSVLTRLPPPHRLDANTVATYLRLGFGRHTCVGVTAGEQRKLVELCAKERIVGGSVYDAFIAAAAIRAKARLLTLDTRARTTYAAVGASYELVV